MKFHPDVLRCHEQFGGDLEDMQRRYDAPDALAAKDVALSEAESMRDYYHRQAKDWRLKYVAEEIEARVAKTDIRDTYLPRIAAKDASLAELARVRGQFENTAQVRDTLYRDLDRVKVELARARKALEPFAKAADQLGPECPDLKDTHGWTFQAGDFRAAARALASQDEGEER